MKILQRGAALVFSAMLLAGAVFASDRAFTVVNVKYQGKVFWLPATLIVKKGDKVMLTLVNDVPDDPNVHGFAIPDFHVQAEVARGIAHRLEFTADKAGLFEINCHMHPAHLKGQLLVLE